MNSNNSLDSATVNGICDDEKKLIKAPTTPQQLSGVVPEVLRLRCTTRYLAALRKTRAHANLFTKYIHPVDVIPFHNSLHDGDSHDMFGCTSCVTTAVHSRRTHVGTNRDRSWLASVRRQMRVVLLICARALPPR